MTDSKKSAYVVSDRDRDIDILIKLRLELRTILYFNICTYIFSKYNFKSYLTVLHFTVGKMATYEFVGPKLLKQRIFKINNFLAQF